MFLRARVSAHISESSTTRILCRIVCYFDSLLAHNTSKTFMCLTYSSAGTSVDAQDDSKHSCFGPLTRAHARKSSQSFVCVFAQARVLLCLVLDALTRMYRHLKNPGFFELVLARLHNICVFVGVRSLDHLGICQEHYDLCALVHASAPNYARGESSDAPF